MNKKLPLLFCLLSGVLIATSPIHAEKPSTSLLAGPPLETEPLLHNSSTPTLSLEDLPAGFQPLPPEFTAQIAQQLLALGQQLGQENVNPDNLFAFVHPQSFQVVLGFIGEVANAETQANFDNNLLLLQQPQMQQQILSQMQQKLGNMGGIKVVDFASVPELNDIANVSGGFTVRLNMQGQPLRMDLATFRRDDVAVMTAVMYLEPMGAMLPVRDVASTLDRKITGDLPKLPSLSSN